MPASGEPQAEGQRQPEARLEPINGSEALGVARVAINGDEATVSVRTDGNSATLPHAQHIHIGEDSECPTTAADRDGDGFVSTAEGQADDGPVKVSLTTNGDVSGASALAGERFPVADEEESYAYSRTFMLPDGVTAADVDHGVIVVHGIAELFADRSAYDGDPRSSLDDSLPLEATIPALRGGLLLADEDGIDLLDDEDGLLGIINEGDEQPAVR